MSVLGYRFTWHRTEEEKSSSSNSSSSTRKKTIRTGKFAMLCAVCALALRISQKLNTFIVLNMANKGKSFMHRPYCWHKAFFDRISLFASIPHMQTFHFTNISMGKWTSVYAFVCDRHRNLRVNCHFRMHSFDSPTHTCKRCIILSLLQPFHTWHIVSLRCTVSPSKAPDVLNRIVPACHMVSSLLFSGFAFMAIVQRVSIKIDFTLKIFRPIFTIAAPKNDNVSMQPWNKISAHICANQ